VRTRWGEVSLRVHSSNRSCGSGSALDLPRQLSIAQRRGTCSGDGAPAAIHQAGGFKARQPQHLPHDCRNDHRADVAAQPLMVAVAEEDRSVMPASLGIRGT